ncbi:MAG: 1-deoxy-D-xylulose-5-phosphate reductoisomerase [bacterium]|nr:1-deoxy-D-xylulose-5-phosphate reductoisomerase [bacterium]
MKKRIVVLGSTGSIGRNTVEVLEHLQDRFEVVGLAAGLRWRALAEQAALCRPPCVALTDPESADRCRTVAEGRYRVLSGPSAMTDLVEQSDCDCVVSAVVGTAGLPATWRAVELGKHVALANKESLVVAGGLLMPLAERTGARLIPIDSEHSAIHQAMHAGQRPEVARVILTASGGPFRTWSTRQIERATLEDALRHPTWDMGPKISIDSATMMNKALEIIEARWLFDLQPRQIEIVVHPESIVHSLVELRDGSMIAQLGAPDMRTPIQYALTYPERLPGPSKPLCLTDLGPLHFAEPDVHRFPALRLGHEVAGTGGTSGAVFNAANEAAVERFRQGEIRFPDIVGMTEAVLRRHQVNPSPTLDELLEADRWARSMIGEWGRHEADQVMLDDPGPESRPACRC